MYLSSYHQTSLIGLLLDGRKITPVEVWAAPLGTQPRHLPKRIVLGGCRFGCAVKISFFRAGMM
jgi:hypothetical protein